jgi:ADP-ribose pyrophosphatase
VGDEGAAGAGFAHLADRLVHQGHVWHVAVGTFRAPDGSEFERDIVRSPGAVAAVPLQFDAEGNASVILVRQYRPPYDRAVIEIPAGMRDVEDEPVADTIARELIEEAGVHAARLEPLLEFYPSAGMTDSVLHLYLATELTQGEARREHTEQDMRTGWFTRAEFEAMIVSGRVADAQTLAAYALLLIHDRSSGNGRSGGRCHSQEA